MTQDRRLAEAHEARGEMRSAADELRSALIASGELRGPHRGWWVLLAVLVVGAVAAAGVAVASWVGASSAYTDDDYRRAAAERVEVLLSPDFRQADRSRRILAMATGSFYDEFAQSADSYTTFVRENGTVADGSVDATGVSARAGGSAEVLVIAAVRFADGARPPAPSSPAPGEQRFRLRVVLTPDSGVLKLAAVQYLP